MSRGLVNVAGPSMLLPDSPAYDTTSSHVGPSPQPSSVPIAVDDANDDPPPYSAEGLGDGRGDEGPIPPGTLWLASNLIHSAEGGAASPPLYQLSLAVGFLGDSTSPVRLERLEYSIRRRSAAAAGTGGAAVVPELSTRRRHIYNLALARGDFRLTAQPQVRAALGAVAIRRHKSRRGPGYQAWRLGRGRRSGEAGRGPDPSESAAAELVFEARRESGQGDALQWFAHGRCVPSGMSTSPGPGGRAAPGGLLVAREDQSEAEGMYRLVIVAPLERRAREALVAMWCCRLWEDNIVRNTPRFPTLSDMRRVTALSREARSQMR